MLVSGKIFAFAVTTAFIVAIAAGLIVHFFLRPSLPHEYADLDAITAYAKKLPEFPNSDDNDWLDPTYKTFNKTRQASSLTYFLRALGIAPIEPWSPRYLAHLLKALTKVNHDFGLFNGKESFIHIKSDDDTVMYVFGDLHGAFHSLVRDLGYLRSEGIIDNNLTMQKSNVYFVFNGDAIDRSPYSIDSLILIATLLKANPTNVFYVAGRHERDSHWVDYGLRRELIDRGRFLSTQEVPFQDVIDSYFRTLPEAIYVSFARSKNQVFRVAFHAQEQLNFNETNLSTGFLAQRERVKAHVFLKRLQNDARLDTRAAIKTEEWRSSNRIRKGLALLQQDQGATTWAILSSPTTVHRVYLDFNYDAFGRIDFSNDVLDATISRIFSDTRTQSGFKKDPPINLISAKMTPTSNHRVVKVASTMSLVRGVPTMGRQIQRGLDLSINIFNHDDNNIRHLLRLYIDNDDYVPKIARSNVIRYLNENIPFLILPTGTPTTMAYIDLVKDRNMLVMFPITGSMGLRKPDYKNLVHFRATYEDEMRALISELRSEYGALKFAFFYQDDTFGRGPFATAVQELKKLGITDVQGLPYTRGTTTFDVQIKNFEKAQPDALGFIATATASQEFMRQLGVNALANTKLFAISFAAESTLRRYAKNHGLQFLFGAVVPNPKTDTSPIAKRYRKAMDEANLSYDVFSFEAFIASNIFLHALEQVGHREITAQNVLKALESIQHHNFEGVLLDFNKFTRSLAQHVWLETGDDNTWKEYHIH